MIRTDLPLEKIKSSFVESHDVELYVYRLDLNHPQISGNKPHKLKYNLEAAKAQNKKTLLTFGGAFSNHIAATAAAGKEQGFRTIGIIRGEALEGGNPTLNFAEECGMELHFVSRTLYSDKEALTKFVDEKFSEANCFIIPEGGSNEEGITGCSEIIKEIPLDFDIVCCPCGTGTTLAGIILSLKPHQSAIGFQVLKGEGYIKQEVKKWLERHPTASKKWEVNEGYHFGGYAKLKPELLNFMLGFEKENAIPLDYIYTGKMMFGLLELIRQEKFKKGSRIIALHTGGLQGNRGFEN